MKNFYRRLRLSIYLYRKKIRKELEEKKENSSLKAQTADFLFWLWEHKIGVTIVLIFTLLFSNSQIQNTEINIYYNSIIPFFLNCLKIGLVIIALIYLLAGFVNIHDWECIYDKELSNRDKINLKKGFNRLSVILSAIITIFAFLIFILCQYSNYTYNDENFKSLIIGLAIIVFGTFATYLILRILYIIFEKIIIWLFKGFTQK